MPFEYFDVVKLVKTNQDVISKDLHSPNSSELRASSILSESTLIIIITDALGVIIPITSRI